MKFNLCKLKPKSPLHLGIREGFREGTDIIIHSDTLFSSFCHSYLLLYGKGELEELLKRFIDNDQPFIISSCFPYWNGEFYFPIPENQIPKDKRLKKKIFVEKSSFEELLSGKQIEGIELDKFIPNDKNEKPYTITNVPRIALSRVTSHPGENYFHFGEVIYQENAGLFFLYELRDKNIEDKFKATLRHICDEGIGGDRSSGKGFFEYPEFTSIEITLPDNNTTGVIILSLFLPNRNELDDVRDSYYRIIDRRGYIYSPQGQSLRRKSVRMFTEGSVFSSKKFGKIADVTPQIFSGHKVYRYGLAFTLPCVLEVLK